MIDQKIITFPVPHQNFDFKILNKFRKIQLSLDYKKKKSKFIIKNNFTNRFIKKQIKYILKQIH